MIDCSVWTQSPLITANFCKWATCTKTNMDNNQQIDLIMCKKKPKLMEKASEFGWDTTFHIPNF